MNKSQGPARVFILVANRFQSTFRFFAMLCYVTSAQWHCARLAFLARALFQIGTAAEGTALLRNSSFVIYDDAVHGSSQTWALASVCFVMKWSGDANYRERWRSFNCTRSALCIKMHIKSAETFCDCGRLPHLLCTVFFPFANRVLFAVLYLGEKKLLFHLDLNGW